MDTVFYSPGVTTRTIYFTAARGDDQNTLSNIIYALPFESSNDVWGKPMALKLMTIVIPKSHPLLCIHNLAELLGLLIKQGIY